MGEVFAGRYELADPIGRGGVGAVWRAWDHRRRRYVAAKVLQQRDAHSLLRFVREQALRIDHPHVLAPASWAADDDQVLFTMDLVAGGSLVHLVGDYGPLPPAFVCTLVDQLLSGLAAVHAEGVVHRDIKPANLLLEATGTGRPRLRLSDFGIAMRLGEPRLTETNLVVGTPGYLAPEQMLGSEPDFPADLFAVGLVALYLLEGAKPDAKALVQYFAEHGTPGAPKGMPEPLWQVVATLLQPDPASRFRTATGARKALASAAELLPEPGPDDELIEIFDQLGPLPPGFGPDGPFVRASGVRTRAIVDGGTAEGTESGRGADGDGEADASGRVGTAGQAGAADHIGTAGRVGADDGSAARPMAANGVFPSAPDGTGTPRATPAPRGTGTPSGLDTPSGTHARPDEHTGSMSDTGSFRLPPPQGPLHSDPHPGAAARHAGKRGDHGHGLPPRAPQRPAHDPTHPTHPLAPSHQTYAPWSAEPPQRAVPGQRDDASTASYTAQDPQVPAQASPISAGQISAGQISAGPFSAGPIPGAPSNPAPPVHGRRARRANRRRAGPPARIAIPMLLLALACYAVGFWALTRV